jgi:hypothetical protein
MRKDLALMLGFLLLPAFLLVHLTGCAIPGSQLDLNLKAAGKQCQAGDMAGCQAWTNLKAVEGGYAAGGYGGAAPVYAAGPRYGMGWVTPPTPGFPQPIQQGPIGQIGGMNWGY